MKEHNLVLSNEEIKALRDYLYFLAALKIEDENNKDVNKRKDERNFVLQS